MTETFYPIIRKNQALSEKSVISVERIISEAGCVLRERGNGLIKAH
jgi:hypothetical protein